MAVRGAQVSGPRAEKMGGESMITGQPGGLWDTTDLTSPNPLQS